MTLQREIVMATTINKFLIQAALEKAERILGKNQVVALSREDAKRFFKALDNPPEPNAKLLKAVEDYHDRVE